MPPFLNLLQLVLQGLFGALLCFFVDLQQFFDISCLFLQLFLCSSSFLRLSASSSMSMSSLHTSSKPPSFLERTLCPPCTPRPPFFSKASILARSSSFSASRVLVFLSSSHVAEQRLQRQLLYTHLTPNRIYKSIPSYHQSRWPPPRLSLHALFPRIQEHLF